MTATIIHFLIVGHISLSGQIGGTLGTSFAKSSPYSFTQTQFQSSILRVNINASWYNFLYLNAQLGMSRTLTTLGSSHDRRHTRASIFPYTFLIRVQPNHTLLEGGISHQRTEQEIRDSYWGNPRYNGTFRKLWLRFRHNSLLEAYYSRSSFYSTDPAFLRDLFTEAVSISSFYEKPRITFRQNFFYMNYDDALSHDRWRRWWYSFFYSREYERFHLQNTGTFDWEVNRWTGSWISSVRWLYGEQGHLAFSWSEAYSRFQNGETSLGTGVRINQFHRFRPRLSFRQSFSLWDYRNSSKIQKFRWTSALRFLHRTKWLQFSLTPSLTAFRGFWGERPFTQFNFSQGVQLSPRLPEAFYGVNLGFAGFRSWGIHRVQNTSNTYSTKWKISFTASLTRWTWGNILYQWERAKGDLLVEDYAFFNAFQFNYLMWRIGVQFRYLPLVFYFQERVDRVFRGWTQSFWLQYQGRFLFRIPFRYLQRWVRANHQGQIQQYWDHQITLSWRLFMLYIEGEAYFRWDVLSNGWYQVYKVRIFRNFTF